MFSIPTCPTNEIHLAIEIDFANLRRTGQKKRSSLTLVRALHDWCHGKPEVTARWYWLFINFGGNFNFRHYFCVGVFIQRQLYSRAVILTFFRGETFIQRQLCSILSIFANILSQIFCYKIDYFSSCHYFQEKDFYSTTTSVKISIFSNQSKFCVLSYFQFNFHFGRKLDFLIQILNQVLSHCKSSHFCQSFEIFFKIFQIFSIKKRFFIQCHLELSSLFLHYFYVAANLFLASFPRAFLQPWNYSHCFAAVV